MLEIVLSHRWSMVTNGPLEEVETAAEILTVGNPAYFQAMKRNFFGVKKHISFFEKGNLFPTGLWPLLLRRLEAAKVEVKVVRSDLMPAPINRRPRPGMFEGLELNEEQIRVIHKLLDAPWPRGYLKAHPGFGKTEVIFALYKCFQPCLAILIVTRAGLREQAFRRCVARLGEEPYVLGQSKGPIPKKGLVVTTYHALAARLLRKANSNGAGGADPEVTALCAKADVVFADEVHRAGAPTYYRCLQKIDADRRYGFSATPMKSNNAVRNMTVRSWVGERLAEVSLKKQVAAGRVAVARLVIRDLGKDDPVEFSEMLPYHAAFMRAYMRYRPFLKAVLQDVMDAVKAGLPALILVEWTRPGETFYRLLANLLGQDKVAFIHGKIPMPERLAIKDRFNAGEVKVLLATAGTFGEGEDLEKMRFIAMACPGRDPGALFQRIGRVIRKKWVGENRGYVSLYWNRRHRYFEGHAKAQLKYLTTSGDRVLYELCGDAALEVVIGTGSDGARTDLLDRQGVLSFEG